MNISKDEVRDILTNLQESEAALWRYVDSKETILIPKEILKMKLGVQNMIRSLMVYDAKNDFFDMNELGKSVVGDLISLARIFTHQIKELDEIEEKSNDEIKSILNHLKEEHESFSKVSTTLTSSLDKLN